MLTQLVSLLQTKENGLSLSENQPRDKRPTMSGSVYDWFTHPKR